MAHRTVAAELRTLNEARRQGWSLLFDCDGCGTTGIAMDVPLWGARFTCRTCNDYSLCVSCFELVTVHPADHPWTKFDLQEARPTPTSTTAHTGHDRLRQPDTPPTTNSNDNVVQFTSDRSSRADADPHVSPMRTRLPAVTRSVDLSMYQPEVVTLPPRHSTGNTAIMHARPATAITRSESSASRHNTVSGSPSSPSPGQGLAPALASPHGSHSRSMHSITSPEATPPSAAGTRASAPHVLTQTASPVLRNRAQTLEGPSPPPRPPKPSSPGGAVQALTPTSSPAARSPRPRRALPPVPSSKMDTGRKSGQQDMAVWWLSQCSIHFLFISSPTASCALCVWRTSGTCALSHVVCSRCDVALLERHWQGTWCCARRAASCRPSRCAQCAGRP